MKGTRVWNIRIIPNTSSMKKIGNIDKRNYNWQKNIIFLDSAISIVDEIEKNSYPKKYKVVANCQTNTT
jgi:hypothetical protein